MLLSVGGRRDLTRRTQLKGYLFQEAQSVKFPFSVLTQPGRPEPLATPRLLCCLLLCPPQNLRQEQELVRSLELS